MTILLIEDDKRLAEFLSFSLTGEKVIIATSLSAAHAILATEKPNLLIVDLNLPDSSGLDTLTALKPYVCPRIVLTAHGRDLACGAAALGASDYISKSDSMDDVIDRIKFNITKLKPAKRQRFDQSTFRQIQAHLTSGRTLVSA